MNLKSILISFLVHATIVVSLLFSSGVFKEPPQSIVEIEIKEIPKIIKRPGQASVHRAKDQRGQGIKGYKAAWNKIDTNQFFPSMNSNELVEKVEQNTAWAKNSGAKKATGEFNSSRTFVSGAEDFFGDGDNKNWSYYQEIYRRIDTHLMFDSLLAQYGHFGRVYVQFKVTEDGVFLMDDLKTDAEDAILKVHVLRAIKKSLEEPLEKTKFAKESMPTLFKARFDFTLDSPDNNFFKQTEFGRPVLRFTRSTRETPVPTELLEHLMTGGINIDPFALADRWQKYNRKKYRDTVQFDPFQSYKRDAFYEM